MKKQKGLSMLLVIFIIIVLALLGVAIQQISRSSQQDATNDYLSEVLYQAAKTGIEYQKYQILRNNSCLSGNLTFQSNSMSFPIKTDCLATTAVEAGETKTIYSISSVSCNTNSCPSISPNANYVERKFVSLIVK